jgi:hypothetical protein
MVLSWLYMAGTGRKPYESTDVAPFGAESRRLAPPECLGNLQKQAFLDLITSVPRSQFRRCDLPLLCRWCELTVLAEQAAFELEQAGAVVDGKISPWFSIHQGASRELRALSQRLQLGPRGRTPKAPKIKTGSVSYYERMDLEGEFDDSN